MGFGYVGKEYEARGGNAKLAQRYENLYKMQNQAQADGLIEDGYGKPTGLKSAFFKVVDLISRPNYAVAGAIDTLAGNGRPGEWVPQRMARELFSGLAGIEGDKEMFGDVLKQAGVGEMGHLSDLVGENGITRRWDPTLRGAAGLALDIFTDPLTYISMPIKNAAKILGKGGEIRYLSKEGMKEIGTRYAAKIAEYRNAFGLSEDVSEGVVLNRLARSKEFLEEQGRLAEAMTRGDRMTHVMASSVVQKQLGRDMLAEAVDMGAEASKWFEKTGLRFRVGSAIDLPVGVDKAVVGSAKKIGELLSIGADKTAIGRWVANGGGEAIEHLSNIFTRHPLLAHRNKAYMALEEERFALHNGSEHIARLESGEMLGGIPRKMRRDREFITKLARAIENPKDAATLNDFAQYAAANGVERPLSVIGKIQGRMVSLGQTEVRTGLMEKELADTFMGRYFPRDMSMVKKATPDVVPFIKKNDKFQISMGQYVEPRVHESFDDFIKGMEDAKLGDQINWNLDTILQNRLSTHYKAVTDYHFAEEINFMFGLGAQAEVKATSNALKSVLKDSDGLSKSDERFVSDYLRRSTTYSGAEAAKQAKAAELTQVLMETPEGQMLERLSRIIGDSKDEIAKAKLGALKADAAKKFQNYRSAVRKAETTELLEESGGLAKASPEVLEQARKNRAYLKEASKDVEDIRETIAGLKKKTKLARLKGKLARSQVKRIKSQMADYLPKTLDDITARDVAQLRNVSRGARVAVLSRMMDKISTVEHAAHFFSKYDDVLKSVDIAEVNKVREAVNGRTAVDWVDALGQPYVKQTVKIANTQMELTIPKGIAQDMDRWKGVWQQNPEVGGMLRGFDFVNNTFKVGVTRYYLSFNIRNGYANVAASFMDIGMAAFNPKFHKMAIDILRGKDGTVIDHLGNKILHRQLLGEMDSLGIHVDKFAIAEMTGVRNFSDPLEAINLHELEQAGLRQRAAGFVNKVISIPGGIENEARALHYMVLRMRGYAMADAAHQVNKFLFDYAALSAAERNAFKRIFPFYTWTSKNVRQQVKNLYEHPGRVAIQTKMFAGDRGPEADSLPEYLRGQMSVQLSEGDGGESWITGIDLPIKNIDILWKGGIGKTMKDQLSMVTPILKQPLEFGLGKELFSGQPTRGINRVPQRLATSMERNLPKWAKDYLNFEQRTEGDHTYYVANSTKMYLTFKALFLGRLTSEGIRVDEMAQELGQGDVVRGAFGMLRLASGLQIRDMDLTEAAQARLYSRSKRLEDILVHSGRMQEFTKRYIPKPAEVQQPGGFGAGTPGRGYARQ